MNLDDLSNTYSGCFQAASTKYWHTTSADLRARRCKGSFRGRHTENDVDISWRSRLPRCLWMCCPWPNARLSDRLVSAPSHQLFTALLFAASSCGVAMEDSRLDSPVLCYLACPMPNPFFREDPQWRNCRKLEVDYSNRVSWLFPLDGHSQMISLRHPPNPFNG